MVNSMVRVMGNGSVAATGTYEQLKSLEYLSKTKPMAEKQSSKIILGLGESNQNWITTCYYWGLDKYKI